MISLQKFFGKDDQFLDLLEASAQECLASVQALKHILKPDAKLSVDQFAASRRKDKQITNEISELLCKTSVTGLEREDIESIANSLYKIPKTAEKFAERYILFADRLRHVNWDRHLDLMGQATEMVLSMVRELRAKSHLEKIKGQNDQLQKIEGEADKLVLESLKNLCSGSPDPITVIILKDLYELLEKVVDRCRDTGNVISNIILKNY
ncbi:MAG: phosphate transport regulator [Verrucomicrobiaceae bacterium]|nr:phosphate transport regulator [Verrucomicrobiaceae bacterium]